MRDKLKNCPLCDSDNVEVVSSAAYRVKCFSCYTSGSFGDKEEAIKAWNARATDNTIEALVDALKEAQATLREGCFKEARLYALGEIEAALLAAGRGE